MSNFFINSPELIASYGSAPSTERGFNRHLGTHPKENKVIYCSGKNVIVRDVDNPEDCFVYRGHNATTTVAKFSSSGYWVCSGDESGKLIVWSWDNPEHQTKFETHMMAGKITDLEWDPESKRITVCGEGGGGLSCKTFMWDSGNMVGEMVGHTGRVLSIAYKPNRPYRIMSCGEDFATIIYNGPPFRSAHTNRKHTNYVQCVRYSPDGSKAVTVSSDKKVIFYDGKEGTITNTWENAHAGTIYSVCWSPDSTMVATSSADKSVKVWNVESGDTVATFSAGTDLGDMQVAVVWKADKIISLSLSGNLNIWQVDSQAPVGVLMGHQMQLTAVCADAQTGTIFTGSSDGVICHWNEGIGVKFSGAQPRSIPGAIHGGRVAGIAVTSAGVVSAGWDNALRFGDASAGSFGDSVSTDGQPLCMSAVGAGSDVVALATSTGIYVYSGKSVAASVTGLAYEPLSIAINAAGDTVAVGAGNNSIFVYSYDGSSLTQTQEVTGHRGMVTCLAFNASGEFLAAGDAYKEIKVWKTADWTTKINGVWVFHTSRVLCLAWSPDGLHLASGGQDTNVIVWNVKKKLKKKIIPFCHMGGVTDIAYVNENTVATVGLDQTLCKWNVEGAC